MIGRCEIEFHQFKDRLEETWSLPTCQSVNCLDYRHSLNRQIGISRRSANSSVVQFSTASELTQTVRLPRFLSEALYSLQLRMRYVAFFFIARKAYHVTSSATFHSDLCNKAPS